MTTRTSPPFTAWPGSTHAGPWPSGRSPPRGALGVYSDVGPAQPQEPASNILYIDPAWPLTDGCVTVPGYDIPILPASGVIQAAIYWTIVSERARLKP